MVWYGRFYCSKINLKIIKKKVKISIVIDKIMIIIIV